MNQRQNSRGDASSLVFVVDDEPMLLEMAAAILQPAGFQVRVFGEPRQALAEFAAAQPPPAVLVTDYAMGDMSGLDLIRECKRLQPRQKTILLSGTVDESIFANAPVKPDRFLAKPYQIGRLLEMVQTLAREHAAAEGKAESSRL
ncbi:MAG: response regulator [Verrucomicrobiota bacterium]|nr:response regulator [Verrucomicrobiota bacterium]